MKGPKISKKALQKQCEDIICENEGYLTGESIKEVLNDIDRYYDGITIYWGCINVKMLDERF